MDTIFLIDEHIMKELIPVLGQRLKFKAKWTEAKLLNDTSFDLNSSEINLIIPNQVVSKEVNASEKSPCVSAVTLSLLPNTIPDFDLHDLLQTSVGGVNIVNQYNKSGMLSATTRTRLVDIIIKHIYVHLEKICPKPHNYEFIARKITSLFPNESIYTYYVPAIPKAQSSTGKHIMARGRIVDKVRNIRYRMGKDFAEKQRFCAAESSTSIEPQLLYTTFEEDITFLRINRDPWDLVFEKWQATFEWRHQSNKELATVDDFLKLWPILNDKRANSLIYSDFDRLYPHTGTSLLLNWDTAFNKIFALKSEIRDIEARELSTLIWKEDVLPDTKVAVQFFILPHLIPPKGRLGTKGNKKQWKFSCVESQQSLIVLVENADKISDAVEKRRNFCVNRGIQTQPYLLLVGSTFEAISATYVVVDKIQFESPSVLSGIDLCFKIFQVTDACYPPESQHIWQLMQKGIYHVSTKFDKEYPHISDLLQKLLV